MAASEDRRADPELDPGTFELEEPGVSEVADLLERDRLVDELPPDCAPAEDELTGAVLLADEDTIVDCRTPGETVLNGLPRDAEAVEFVTEEDGRSPVGATPVLKFGWIPEDPGVSNEYVEESEHVVVLELEIELELEPVLPVCGPAAEPFVVVEIELTSGSGMLVVKAGVPPAEIVIGNAVIVVTYALALPDGVTIVWVMVDVYATAMVVVMSVVLVDVV